MTDPAAGTTKDIGRYGTLDIAAMVADASTAPVELACACMFSHEVEGHELSGGLAHLDQALSGRLVAMREAGVLGSARFQTFLLDSPGDAIAAEHLLLIHLGKPEDWSAAMMEQAAWSALSSAAALGVKSVALAPGLLDSGFAREANEGAPEAMIKGLIAYVDSHATAQDAGLASALSVENWYFGAGAANLDGAVSGFKTALGALSGSSG